MYNNTDKSNLVAIGDSALYSNTTGTSNTAVGSKALYSNTTGDYNTAVGYLAGSSSTGEGNVFLGHKAGYYETGDNKLHIANTDSKTLIWGDFDKDSVVINGDLYITGKLISETKYQVGDFAQGGVVFWVDETGEHGLVCAKTDQSTAVRWYAGS